MVLTGDTILGEGTTVVAYPDGNLADYLASLARLQELGAATVLPGHGPELSSAGEVATGVSGAPGEATCGSRTALAALGPDATADAIVERVYADV
jgi:glyoxylase-like metal-dependent hydrolase (beta-lactamase superfamily II)